MRTIAVWIIMLHASLLAFACSSEGNGSPKPTYSLTGSISNQNVGLVNVTVTLHGVSHKETILTDQNGTFTFSRVQPGLYRITVAKENYGFTPLSRDLTLGEADIAGLDFTTCTGYTVTGSVAGDSASRYNVKVTIAGNAGELSTLTDNNGAFSFPNIPQGDYVVAAEKEDMAFCPISRSITITDANIDGLLYTTGASFWEKSFGGSYDESAVSIASTGDGGLVAAGSSYTNGRRKDIYCVKADGHGNLVWERSYGGYYDDEAVVIRETADKGFLILGETVSFGSGGSDYLLMKIDYYGTYKWHKTYGSPVCESPHALYIAADGTAVITGYKMEEGSINKDAWVIKVDQAGEVIWEQSFGIAGCDDDLLALSATGDSVFTLAGYTTSVFGDRDIRVLKIDRESGNVIWNRTFGDDKDEVAVSLLESNGAYLVAGTTTTLSNGDADMFLLKLTSDGTLLFEKFYDYAKKDITSSILAAGDDAYILSGTQMDATYNKDGVLVKVDNAGTLLWRKTYGNTPQDEAITALCAGPAGLFSAAGYRYTADTGKQLWIVNPGTDGSL